jgi:heat shock protein HtpX
MERIPQQDLRASSELAAFYIFPPTVKSAIGNIFSTHPPLEKRLEKLGQLEAQLQGTAARV